jgi:hypothetical protein
MKNNFNYEHAFRDPQRIADILNQWEWEEAQRERDHAEWLVAMMHIPAMVQKPCMDCGRPVGDVAVHAPAICDECLEARR